MASNEGRTGHRARNRPDGQSRSTTGWSDARRPNIDSKACQLQYRRKVRVRRGCQDDDPHHELLDAYLVAENSRGAPPVGVVRKDGKVWRILQFEIPADQQPSEVFATRREAGARLMELAARS